MTRIEYDILADDHPELKLPCWPLLWERDCVWILRHTQDELVACVTSSILRGEDRFSVLSGSRSVCFPS